MDVVFWDIRGIIQVDYLENGETNNRKYYLNLLDSFKYKDFLEIQAMEKSGLNVSN